MTKEEIAIRYHLLYLGDEVISEVLRARRKHGDESMTSLSLDLGKRLGILGEEFGEVCRATTYDGGDEANLREELVQTAAMCLAWLLTLPRRPWTVAELDKELT